MSRYAELRNIGMNLKPQKYLNEVKEMFDPYYEKVKRTQKRVLPDNNFFNFDEPLRSRMSKPMRESMESDPPVMISNCMACQLYRDRIVFLEKIITILVIGVLAKLLLDSLNKKKGMSGGGRFF